MTDNTTKSMTRRHVLSATGAGLLIRQWIMDGAKDD